MTDEARPVTVSFTVQEANELAYAAKTGNPLSYVNRGLVGATIERIEAAARKVEGESALLELP